MYVSVYKNSKLTIGFNKHWIMLYKTTHIYKILLNVLGNRGIIRRCKRTDNTIAKWKRAINDIRNITQKTKYRSTWIPLKTGVEIKTFLNHCFVLLDLSFSKHFFVDHCLFFYPFSFGYCVVYYSSISGLWLLLWYLQTS